MKKIILSLLIVLIVIIVVVLVNISNNKRDLTLISKFNLQFESYENRSLYGADVLSLINKAIDNNKTYNVEKDKDGNYIEDENSIKVEVILLSQDEDGNIKEVKYPMETLEKAGLDGFVTSFSLVNFECKILNYNDIGKVSKLQVKQLEL